MEISRILSVLLLSLLLVSVCFANSKEKESQVESETENNAKEEETGEKADGSVHNPYVLATPHPLQVSSPQPILVSPPTMKIKDGKIITESHEILYVNAPEGVPVPQALHGHEGQERNPHNERDTIYKLLKKHRHRDQGPSPDPHPIHVPVHLNGRYSARLQQQSQEQNNHLVQQQEPGNDENEDMDHSGGIGYGQGLVRQQQHQQQQGQQQPSPDLQQMLSLLLNVSAADLTPGNYNGVQVTGLDGSNLLQYIEGAQGESEQGQSHQHSQRQSQSSREHQSSAERQQLLQYGPPTHGSHGLAPIFYASPEHPASGEQQQQQQHSQGQNSHGHNNRHAPYAYSPPPGYYPPGRGHNPVPALPAHVPLVPVVPHHVPPVPVPLDLNVQLHQHLTQYGPVPVKDDGSVQLLQTTVTVLGPESSNPHPPPGMIPSEPDNHPGTPSPQVSDHAPQPEGPPTAPAFLQFGVGDHVDGGHEEKSPVFQIPESEKHSGELLGVSPRPRPILVETYHTGFGYYCDATKPCSSASFLECIDSKCYCENSYSRIFDEQMQQCVVLVGGKCDEGITDGPQCVRNSHCEFGKCMCNRGYSATNNKLCLKDVHQTCKPHECNGDRGLGCKGGKCKCIDSMMKYHPLSHKCVQHGGGVFSHLINFGSDEGSHGFRLGRTVDSALTVAGNVLSFGPLTAYGHHGGGGGHGH